MGWDQQANLCYCHRALHVYGWVCWFTYNIILLFSFDCVLCSRGEVCSHVAAILFKVEAFIRLGLATLTCTSQPCLWNQAYSKKVTHNSLSILFVIIFLLPFLYFFPIYFLLGWTLSSSQYKTRSPKSLSWKFYSASISHSSN